MRRPASFLAGAAMAVAVCVSAGTQAGTLENLERERAILLQSLLSSDITAEQRQGKVEVSRNRLVDLERMVLRDKTLVGRNTPTVRAAFENYDLTFLVHASVEHDRALLDHWLEAIGVSSETLMNARLGRR